MVNENKGQDTRAQAGKAPGLAELSAALQQSCRATTAAINRDPHNTQQLDPARCEPGEFAKRHMGNISRTLEYVIPARPEPIPAPQNLPYHPGRSGGQYAERQL